MFITTTLTQKQIRQVHNLMMNCRNKQEMAEHLLDIGINAFHSIHMSNSFNSLYEGRTMVKVSFTVLPIHDFHRARTYEAGMYEPCLVGPKISPFTLKVID